MYHSTVKMAPFESLHGFAPSFHVPYFLKHSNVETMDVILRDRKEHILMLKFHLERARNRLKQTADRKWLDRNFEIGN